MSSVARRRTINVNCIPRSLLAVGLILGAVGGCSEDTSIRQYRVAKSDSQRAPAVAQEAAPAKAQQMLAAIVPNKDSAWFFKLTGDPEKVAENREPFKRIVNSVEFGASGDPSWTLAEGWDEQRLSGITFANLTHSAAGLTATVTQLPTTGQATEESWQSYIVSNINRWRTQLSLQGQDWLEMQQELEEVPELSQGPAKAYFVSLLGTGSGSMSGPPMMRQSGLVAASNPPPAAAPAAGKTGPGEPSPAAQTLTYEAPQAWQELPAAGMRRAAFAIEEDEQQAEVTVIAAGGSIDANIGIWLGQVGREANEETKKAVLDAAQDVQVNGVAAKLYTLDGPAAEGEATSILIVDIPWRSAESLFVKFKGTQSMASAQRDTFVKFVESIQW
ncbi:MAG: hypothetical protein KDA45_11405 [Planctomycetales bacterium]|nr:hypothetical protein [Planctomycetales bacterium]